MKATKVTKVKAEKVTKAKTVKKTVVKKAVVAKKAVEVKSKRRTLNGVVTGTKMTKAVKVSVESKMSHPVYSKVITRGKTYFAHTEKELKVGDKVTIRESRPYSKKITWVVV
jgi:small subunit ribosomal protein S17